MLESSRNESNKIKELGLTMKEFVSSLLFKGKKNIGFKPKKKRTKKKHWN